VLSWQRDLSHYEADDGVFGRSYGRQLRLNEIRDCTAKRCETVRWAGAGRGNREVPGTGGWETRRGSMVGRRGAMGATKSDTDELRRNKRSQSTSADAITGGETQVSRREV
jgi:hypothetical protein